MPRAGARQELGFPELVAILHRRCWLLLLGLLVGGSAGLAAAFAMPPVFVARTLLLLEPQAGPAPPAGLAGAAPLDAGAVESQTQILSSRSLAREVVGRLGLAADPELAGAPAADAGSARGLLARIAPAAGEPQLPPARASEADLVGRFLDRLSVRREGKSYVIAVGYRSRDPAHAARVANAVAEVYGEGQLSRKRETAARARGLLAERAEAARVQLAASRQRLEAFRTGTERDRGDGLGTREDQLAEIGRQLVLAGADRSAREARLARLRTSVAVGRVAPMEGGASPLLQNLGALKAELLRKEAELSGRYGDRHPRLLDLRAEKAELEARIAEEQRAQLQGLEGEAEAARARERSLARGLEELKGKALRDDAAARGADALEREVELDRRLYERLVEEVSAAAPGLDGGAHRPDARVISEAVPPGAPSFPKPGLLGTLGGTAGLALGLALVYLLESRDRGFANAGAVEAALGLPALALVPELRDRGGAPPQDHALEKPRSRYAEALREILASLLADRPAGGPGRAVLVTSVLPAEGKSTLVLSLARLAASEGLRVLAVDVDLRRPALHRLAGLEPGPGVVELLRGEVDPDEALRVDPRTELRILASSGRLSQPTRLLAADRLGRVVELARARFDLVLLDAAPTAAVADPRLLAPLVDRTLLLVRHGSTRRQPCERAVASLRGAGATIAGVVLTRVDPRRQRAAAAAELGPAHARLQGYYAD